MIRRQWRAGLVLLGLVAAAAPARAQIEAQFGQIDPAAGLVELVVTIQGMDGVEGSLRVALFDSADSFTDEPLLAAVLPVDSAAAEWRLTLPRGVYAVAAIHDRDGNGELNTNLLGMPRERYGFSNGARGSFGPPSFDDASFDLTEATARQAVEVR
jgi:uncharacterized protein (DUF2141 family)